MLYNADSQSLTPGSALSLPDSQLNSPSGDIALFETTGLTLAPGQYLVSFVSDVSITEAGTMAAALALNGSPLVYGSSAISSTGPDSQRLMLSAIVEPTAFAVLNVLNSSDNVNSYENSTLTVVKLA